MTNSLVEYLEFKKILKRNDYWLDKYRDYLLLYDYFGDVYYLNIAEDVPNQMLMYRKDQLKVDDLVLK